MSLFIALLSFFFYGFISVFCFKVVTHWTLAHVFNVFYFSGRDYELDLLSLVYLPVFVVCHIL